jgi:hypothetical protein
VSGPGRVEAMQKPPCSSPSESTEAMVRNIGRELAEIEQGRKRLKSDSSYIYFQILLAVKL